MKPEFFKTQKDFEKWMSKNHSTTSEIIVGFHKVKSQDKGISYKEALDVALCYGWIDGLRKGIDEQTWMIRFTPRKEKSIWSNVNIKRVNELLELKKMQPEGMKAFEKRLAHKSGIYSFEQKKTAVLEKSFENKFRKNKKAWEWFNAQAPSYKKTSVFWVMSAKREETRMNRLSILIADSGNGKKIDVLGKWIGKKK